MKNKYNKIFYEEYARQSIKHIFPNFYDNFKNIDKPDLQNIKDDIAIEVCRAIDDYDGNFLSFVNENIGSDKTDLELITDLCKRLKIKNIENAPFEIITINGTRIFSQNKGLINTSNWVKKVEILIKAKIDKIDIYTEKHQWKELGLYLFAGFTLNKYDFEPLYNLMFNKEKHFDFYIINCIDKMYKINKTKLIEEFEVSEDDLKYFKEKALQMINHSIVK